MPFWEGAYIRYPRSFYEIGISESEFLKFTNQTRFYCALFTNKNSAIGFVDLNPSVITSKVSFMNAIKSAFDASINSINTGYGLTYLKSMNSNEENRARSRVYVSEKYANNGFVAMAYWYFGNFIFDVYPGTLTNYNYSTDTGKIMYNFIGDIDYAKIKTDGTVDFATYNNLGCNHVPEGVILPTKNYTIP